MQYAELEQTIYLWFASNDTGGSGSDGATPVFDVHEGGAAAGAIPTLSGNATLLTHANYPDGCHEIAVAATAANGFAVDKTYGVFCTLLVDSENPSGLVGAFRLAPVPSNVTQVLGTPPTGVGGTVDANVVDWLGAAAPANTGDAFAEAEFVSSKLGTFTLSDGNTVKGWLAAMMSDSALLPDGIGGGYDNATMSMEASFASLVKALAAVYDTATADAGTGIITLSNGKTQTISSTGRVTSP